MAKCRITVLKQFFDEELAKTYLQDTKDLCPCSFFPQIGQSWLIDESCAMPEGFCKSAWGSLERNVFTFTRGGAYIAKNWMKDENKMLTCCTDAVRPVVFLLERVDD